MRIAIDCVHTPISDRLASHRASWSKYWKYYLETKGNVVDILHKKDDINWSEYDEVYLYHGMEFSGVVNFIGGVAPWQIERFKKFGDWMNSHQDIPVYSIEHDMPDYHEILSKRNIDIPQLFGATDRIKKVILPDSQRQVVIGDSHSLSAMRPISNDFVRVYRNDFKTLNGALNVGLENFGDLSAAEYASFYFGSIDIRHHALRHGPMRDTVYNLTRRYYDALKEISNKGIQIEVIGLLPQPSDDRKLPKSGFYEGTPFFGTLQERQLAIDFFNQEMLNVCRHEGWDFFSWPIQYYNDDGTLNQDYMEKPQSVHMSQSAYRYDFEKGEVRDV